MNNAGSRRFTRVNFRQAVQLDFGERHYERQLISNISLGGMYIKGQFEQRPGDVCAITMRPAWPGMPDDFRAKGAVVWVSDEGMAIEFVSMGYDSFLYLQTALLYEAEDPVALSGEFSDRSVLYDIAEEQGASEVEGAQHPPAGK